MIRNLLKGITLAGTLAVTACGGGPDIDQVKADFDSPSGSVSDKSTMLKASESRDASNPALKVAGGSSAFTGGVGLTMADAKWSRLHPANLLKNHIANSIAMRGSPEKLAARRFGQADISADVDLSAGGCFNPADISGSGSVGTDGSAEGSFSFSMDLSCVGGTGSVDIDGEYEVSQTKLYYLVEETFADACFEGNCVNGSLLVEMDAPEGLQIGLGGSGGSLKMLTAWDLTAKWTEAGASHEASTKGGMRVAASSTSGELEYLVYVNDGGGSEVTYVLKISANENGGSLSYKGGNGEVNCTVMADGSGSCTGSGELSWTADEVAAAAADLEDD
ncbi:MAG: hypothetical protein HY791_27845 [Deltaproteobacteria bacterium]|nr:hypothetical protein [Deltaproteobacteria bacterium]